MINIIKHSDYCYIGCGDYPYCHCHNEIKDMDKLIEQRRKMQPYSNFYGCVYVGTIFHWSNKNEHQLHTLVENNYLIYLPLGWHSLYDYNINYKCDHFFYKEDKYTVVPVYLIDFSKNIINKNIQFEYNLYHNKNAIHPNMYTGSDYYDGYSDIQWCLLDLDNPKFKLLAQIRVLYHK